MKKGKLACVVIGAAGRMGKRICQILVCDDGFTLVGATESPNHPQLGKILTEVVKDGENDIILAESLEDIKKPFDIIIDFTHPKVSLETARFANREKKAAVIGTTGFSQSEMQELTALAKGFPCVCAPNMSTGVNLLFKLVKDVSVILKEEFDVEIMEIHHRHKKDAPSGTAQKVAQILAESYNKELSEIGVYQRKGFIGERKSGEIGIQSLRAGDIVGEHLVLFGGPGERLELIHRAHSRDCFVRGALRAARWVAGMPNGLYDMQDVLGLKQG